MVVTLDESCLDAMAVLLGAFLWESGLLVRAEAELFIFFPVKNLVGIQLLRCDWK